MNIKASDNSGTLQAYVMQLSYCHLPRPAASLSFCDHTW